MRGGRCAAVVAGILLLSAGCASSVANHVTTSPGVVASANPETSPSTSASPTGAGPLAIVSLPFHNGEVALSYSATTLAANGGTQPYTWSIASGSFPPGLGLSPGGYVTGTPSAAGQFSFRVKLADAAGGTANRAASITVYKAMTVSQPCAGQCVIGVGCSKCGGFGSVTGGLGTYTYQVVSGRVPAGMTLGFLSLKGAFPQGSYSLGIQVSDALGAQTTVHANWSIYGPAKLSAGTGCAAINNNPPISPCRTTGWTYSGGSQAVAPKVVIVGYSQYCEQYTGVCYPIPTAPPKGWMAVAKSGTISISASGIPCNSSNYAGVLALALIDPALCATTSQSNRANLQVVLLNNC